MKRCILVALCGIVFLSSTTNGACPSGFKEHVGRCLHISNAPRSKASAQNYCASRGINGTLTTVGDQAMLGFMAREAQDWSGASTGVWTSGQHVNGAWQWSSNSPITSGPYWLDAHPRTSGQGCLGVGVQGRWVDLDCSELMRPVCEHRWLKPTAAKNVYDYTAAMNWEVQTTTFHSQLQEVAFSCDVHTVRAAAPTFVSRYTNIVVQWFVDNKSVKNSSHASAASLPDVIHEYEWVDISDTDGRDIYCQIQATVGVVGKAAPAFFVGFKIEATTLRVPEGATDHVRVYPTVPILCPAYDPACSLDFSVNVTEVANTAVCADGTAQQQLVFQHSSCTWGVPGTTADWWQGLEVPVLATLDGQYDGDATLHVDLNTELESFHLLWSNLKLPKITVTAVDESRKLAGSVCSSYNDPHMTTFDGNRYENQNEGEFILYKHKTTPSEVRVFYRKCGSYPRCNCGAAVRSGDSVFLVDTCSKSYDPRPLRIEQTGCTAGALRVEQHGQGNIYKVYMASGAMATITVHGKWINVAVTPAESDAGQVVGLCGDFNKACGDDFYLSNGTYSTAKGVTFGACPSGGSHIQDFSMSWQVPDKYSLYNATWHASLEWPVIQASGTGGSTPNTQQQQLNNYCDCTSDKGFSSNCDASKLASQCVDKTKPVKSSGVTGCGKNVVTSASRAATNYVFEFADRTYPGPGPTWTNGWTQKKAEKHCRESVRDTKIGKLCAKLPNVDLSGPLEQCELDIKLTGDMTFVPDAVEAALALCTAELNRNTTLWDTSGGGGKKFPAVFVAALCPNDCYSARHQGQCVNGTCACNGTYIGENCEQDGAAAPEVVSAGDRGLCDVSVGGCDTAAVFGYNFIDLPALSCVLDKFLLSHKNIRKAISSHKCPASFNNLAEVTCELECAGGRGRRSAGGAGVGIVGYNVTVTNNGVAVSLPTPLLVYNSRCLSCNATTLECSVKPKTCYVDGDCYVGGEASPSHVCHYCTPSVSQTAWTANTTAGGCVADTSLTAGQLAGISAAVVLVLAAAAIAGVCFFFRYRIRKLTSKIEGVEQVERVEKKQKKRALPEVEPAPRSATPEWRPTGSVFKVDSLVQQ